MLAMLPPRMSRRPTDRDLAIRVAAGDAGALGDLRDRYWASAWRVARSLTRDPAVADDIAQEALLRVLRKASDYDPDRPFEPWFFRIVRNLARDHLRAAERRRRHEQASADRAPRRHASPGDAELEREELLGSVRDALSSLEPDLREALVLRYEQELSLKACADVIGCPEGTASSRLRRGLEALRERLGAVVSASVALPSLLAEAAAAQPLPKAPSVADLLARAGRAPASPTSSPPPGRSSLSASTAVAALALILLGGVAVAVGIGVTGGDEPEGARVAAGSGEGSPERGRAPETAGGLPAEDASEGADPRPGAGAAGGPPVAVAADAPAPPGKVDGDPASSEVVLRGRVVMGSRGLPDVEVRLWNVEPYPVTGPDGTFEVAVPAAPGSYFGHHGVSLTRDGENSYNYGPLHGLDARLLDDEGRPLPRSKGGGASWKLPAGLRSLHLELEIPSALFRAEVVDAASGAPIAGATVSAGGLPVRAVTDGAGRFELPLPRAPGRPMARTGGFLRVEAEGYGAVGVHVFEGHFADLATIELSTGRSVEGVVVDTRGRRVAGVLVRATEWVPGRGPGGGSSWSPMITARAETAADGSFVLRDLGLDTSVTLVVTGRPGDDGFAERFHELRLARRRPGADPLELTLRLKTDDRRVEGRVVDRAGGPIEGASVTPLGADPTARLAHARRYHQSTDGSGTRLVDGFRASNRTRTGADGRFTLEGPEAGSALVVTARGYADRIVAAGQTSRDIALEGEEPVRGRIVDEAASALSKWTVSAYPAGTVAAISGEERLSVDALGISRRLPTRPEVVKRVSDERPPRAAALTDDEGRFVLPGLPPGRYDIVGRPDGLAALMRPRALVLENVEAGLLGELTVRDDPRAGVLLQVQAAEDGASLADVLILARQGAHSVPAIGLTPTGEDAARFPAGSLIAQVPFTGRFELEVVAAGRVPVLLELQGEGLIDHGAVSLERAAGAIDLHLRNDEPERALHEVGAFITDAARGVTLRVRAPAAGTERPISIDSLGRGAHEIQVYVREAGDGPVRLLPARTVEIDGGLTVEVHARIPARLEGLRLVE